MRAHVTAYAGLYSYSQSRRGYKILGENPTQSQVFGIAVEQEHKGVIWKESAHKQFDTAFPYDHNNEIGTPKFGYRDGWGLGQLDDARWRNDERILWDWRYNLTQGVTYLNELYTEEDNYLDHHYKNAARNPTIPDWPANPADDANNVWDDAFARYKGQPLYSINGNTGVKNASLRSAECTYVAQVRYHMQHTSWNTPFAPHPEWATLTRNAQCRYD